MLYISSACIKSNNIFDSIKELKTITKNIELSGGTKSQENILDNILILQKNQTFNFLIHNYFPPPVKDFVLNFADTSSKTREFIKKSMKYIDKLNIEYYSIHAGFKKDFTIKDELLLDGINSYKSENIQKNLIWFYDNFDKKLALENLYPNNENDTCFMSSIDEIIEILELDKRVYLLLDLGHLKISSRAYGFDYLKAVNLLFDKYSDRILEIHLSENNGILDEHKIILSDSIQYMILEKFKKSIIKNGINVTIEARNYNLVELEKCYVMINKIIGDDL